MGTTSGAGCASFTPVVAVTGVSMWVSVIRTPRVAS